MAANTARNLNTHYGRLATSTQRLSSGLRINGAADDAAGLAIRELMRADVAALHQGVRNANDAISMIQVVDGALGIIDEKLIRMKELAEQAATGTYDSIQRLMIDSEFQIMASEINRIARATDFNGIKLLDGKSINNEYDDIKLNIPITNTINNTSVNTNRVMNNTKIDERIITTNTTENRTIEYYMKGDDLYQKISSIINYQVINEHNEYFAGNHSGGFTNEFDDEILKKGEKYKDDPNYISINAYDIVSNIDQSPTSQVYRNPSSYYYVNEPGKDLEHRYVFRFDPDNNGNEDIEWNVWLSVNKDIDWVKDNFHLTKISNIKYELSSNTTNQIITKVVDEKVNLKKTNYIKIHFGPMNDSAEDYYYIDKRDCTLKGLGFEDTRIETQDNAQKALTTINDAIIKKDEARAYYGAMQNRLENTISNLTIQAENLQASESRISDVDVATEMTNFVRNQILTQSAVAMLSQANSMPQMAMQLIGG